MKILIDINHPAHVHYFRNFIKIMESKNHQIKITARNRDIIFSLLGLYRLPFYNRGKGYNTRIGKVLYMFLADFRLFIQSLKFKPDLFLSFGSPYAAQVAYILHKPHISIGDTEHTDRVEGIITYPFSKAILTPKSYQTNLGEKQIRFDNIVEALYLASNYYKPDPSIYEILNIGRDEKYVIVRLVAWKAHHDKGQSGVDSSNISDIIKILEKKFVVFISSEEPITEKLSKYELKVPFNRIHDVLNYASLFVGESGTMASESAYLGTPAIYINSLPLMCYLKLEKDYGLLTHFEDSETLVPFLEDIIKNDSLKVDTINKKNNMINGFIDPTKFLVWFIENYPESKKTMKIDPDYQYNFK
jgi:predicted glycosyltransferase